MLLLYVVTLSFIIGNIDGFHSCRRINRKYYLDMVESTINPIKVINDLNGQGIGESWGYSKLINEVKEHHIDGLTFINNGDLAVAIDNIKIDGSYHSENLHYVKILPQTYDTLVELLTKYSVAFDVFGDSVKQVSTMPSMLSQAFFTIGVYSLIVFAVNTFFRLNPNTRNRMGGGGPAEMRQIMDYGNLFRGTGDKKLSSKRN